MAARLFAFLSGPPDYGAGALDTSRYSDPDANGGDDEDKGLLSEQTPYYSDLAALAVQSGVCCDLFVVSEGYCDLASLQPLCSQSGGTLCLYQRLEECTLPQVRSSASGVVVECLGLQIANIPFVMRVIYPTQQLVFRVSTGFDSNVRINVLLRHEFLIVANTEYWSRLQLKTSFQDEQLTDLIDT